MSSTLRAVIKAATERDAAMVKEAGRRLVTQRETPAVQPRQVGRLGRRPSHIG